MKITVNEDQCCGAGMCVELVPEVFDQRDEDAIVVLLEAEPGEALHAAVRDAAAGCPSASINVIENA
ncbi:ferredoxin [Streptomyces sp. NPDC058653]|uniref:ferredoxin n=1 Tax=Streptomyces sp. NPDC058653 TaxID=3346576 RepID=UPI00366023DD